MPTLRRTKVKNGIAVDKREISSMVLSRQELKAIDNPQIRIDLRKLIDAAITENDWVNILKLARDKAMDGDRLWAEFLFKYRWGLPSMMVQHAGKTNNSITIVEVIRDSKEPEEESEIIDGTAEEAQ